MLPSLVSIIISIENTNTSFSFHSLLLVVTVFITMRTYQNAITYHVIPSTPYCFFSHAEPWAFPFYVGERATFDYKITKLATME